MCEILDNIYIWVFLVSSESGLHLGLVRFLVCSHFTQNDIFCYYNYYYHYYYFLYFLGVKNPCFVRKIVENLLIFLHLFCPKNCKIGFAKVFITPEWLVLESFPTPHWIALLMLYRLVYKIRSHLSELILAWSDYFVEGHIY